MASVSAREASTRWISLINNKERYYFSKAMDVFCDMTLEDQRSFLEFFSKEAENKDWESKLDDNTQYASVIRSVLFYYSGNPELKQPNKAEFKELVGKWIRERTKSMRKVIKRKEATSFKEELEDI